MKNTSNTSAASNNSSNYINLHVTGIGYLGRVREVAVRKGEPFMACSIRAMFGEKGVKDGVQYTSFDVKAVTEQAAGILRDAYADANNKDKRVTVQFKISDPEICTFQYTTGEKIGTSGVTMKGRLLRIERVWVKDLLLAGDEQAGQVLVYEYIAPEAQNSDAAQEPAKTGTNE
ncbi:MAG: DUF3577 domain-containing protein [Burkholderiaceae bacterium]|nr:DUF3577 domain-containing protein [Burkholderiaceae bacterium]